ncbi:MAG TPA: tRNA (adenosine(37)-N6)-threonylcarbamoyltransferase complex dimerization subunit type 1 TsaB [Candidatus Saccharimonadales bacterium]|nr:tRNA (adenosine(37)-N6)-threonylcarbamoyltransferase complex dimerization subunit type 1 TsaB [Candidatus Saccharimonadales bacterium]
MIILTIRTDKPQAELGVYNGEKRLAYEIWLAHRELAETIHKKIDDILAKSGKNLDDLQGIAVFEGPGSFTGLRIGMAVANTMAYGLDIPIVAAKGDDWLEQGIKKLLAGQNDKTALPNYGSPAHVTEQRK